MAIDHPTEAETRLSAIENELPSYRAIHPMAILSLLAGVASLLGFADLWFLAIAAGAVALGAIALRAIARDPDLYTGRNFALGGIVMALVIAVCSTSWTLAEQWRLRSDVRQFAQKCVDTINTRRVPDILWWRMPPSNRRGLTPAQAIQKLQETMPDKGNQERMVGELKRLTDLLTKHDGKVEFLKLEEYGVRDLSPYGIVLLKVDLPGYKGTDEGEKYAIIVMNKDTKATSNPWWIQHVGYPYQPKSFVMPAKPLDDGHDHGGGDEHGH